MEKRIVIYDENISYAERLMNYIESEGGYTVYLFTVWDKLLEHMEKNILDHYLLQDSEYSREAIKRFGVQGILLSDNRNLEKMDLCNCIYRYKSAEEILDSVINRISDNVIKDADKKTYVYAFVSPSHRSDLDNILYEISDCSTKRVLVVDFRYINFWDMVSKESKRNLSDLLYLLKDDFAKLSTLVKEFVSNLNNLDIIYGLSTESDVMELESKDIDNLIAVFMEMECYDRIYFLCDTLLLDIIALSSIQNNIVWFTRGSILEENIMEVYKNSNFDVYKHINLKAVKDSIEIYLPEYCCGKDEKMKELTERFITDGIL